jgi:hypothetical protein
MKSAREARAQRALTRLHASRRTRGELALARLRLVRLRAALGRIRRVYEHRAALERAERDDCVDCDSLAASAGLIAELRRRTAPLHGGRTA